MSPCTFLYLDYAQFPVPDGQEYIGGLNTLAMVYSYDPLSGFDADVAKFVLGVQANMWSEFVWEQDDLQWKLFPRAAALAEISWTAIKDWNRFLNGLYTEEYRRLKVLGVAAAPIVFGQTPEWALASSRRTGRHFSGRSPALSDTPRGMRSLSSTGAATIRCGSGTCN
jgi:hexosaminidase